MEEVIEAIYEDGVLKPLKKLNLREGEKVKLEIKSDEVIDENFIDFLEKLRAKLPKSENVYKILEEIRK